MHNVWARSPTPTFTSTGHPRSARMSVSRSGRRAGISAATPASVTGGPTCSTASETGSTTRTTASVSGRATSIVGPSTAEDSGSEAPSSFATAVGYPPPLPQSMSHASQPTSRQALRTIDCSYGGRGGGRLSGTASTALPPATDCRSSRSTTIYVCPPIHAPFVNARHRLARGLPLPGPRVPDTLLLKPASLPVRSLAPTLHPTRQAYASRYR